MSSKHEDYVREQRKGEIFGGNAIDSSTAGGRAAHYEDLGKQATSGGGSVVDGYILLGIGALLIWPVGIMALVATFIFLALKRWPGVNGSLRFWAAFRRLYLASLAFAATLVASGLVAALFWDSFPSSSLGTIFVRALGLVIPFALAVLSAGWALRGRTILVTDDGAHATRVALAVVLPAFVITAFVITASAFFALAQLLG